MADSDLIACNQDHELEYILRDREKRQTNDNIEKMRDACKAYKDDPDYQPHNRDNFLKYLDDKNIWDDLE
jgi:hypothetical protein